jgi:hypothetical protein
MLAPGSAQIANVRAWNQTYDWGFTDADFDTLNISNDDVQSITEAKVVMVWRDSLEETFETWCRVISDTFGRSKRFNQLQSDPEHLRLENGSIFYSNRIEIVKLELTAHWDGTGAPTIEHGIPATVEVLAAAAHFPDWVKNMDGCTIPFASMAGLRASSDGYPWEIVPSVGYDEDLGIVVTGGILGAPYPTRRHAQPIRLS